VREIDRRVLLYCFAGCAAEAVLEAVGLTWPELYEGNTRPFFELPRPAPTSTPSEGQRRKLERFWAASRPINPHDPVGNYLSGRGLHLAQYPKALRYHPLLHLPSEHNPFGRWPGMVARVEHPTHGLVALHRTILTGAGRVKKLTPAVLEGATNGAAIRLFLPQKGQPLALAEGIETALAVHVLAGWSVWSCISAGGLEGVLLPEDARDVVVCPDHDRNGVGQGAAQKLALRLLAEGRAVRIATPPTPGSDWADVLATEQG
jgi:hypothetical protein